MFDALDTPIADALDTPIAYVLTDDGQAGACVWSDAYAGFDAAFACRPRFLARMRWASCHRSAVPFGDAT